MKVAWVPFATWHSWSPEERGQFATYCENKGLKLAIDLEHDKENIQKIVQKDVDEYREEMSLGGNNYDPYKVG